MNTSFVKAMLLSLSLAAAPSAALSAGVGDPLPGWQLQDSFGKPKTVDRGVQRIYASADRAGDALLKEALGESGQSLLDAQHAVVVADISAAPGFVKYLIRSSLKDRSYSTWLDNSGAIKASIVFVADQITLLELEQGQIKALRHIADAVALKRELEAPQAK